jgi:ribosomal protein L6P/L9E
LGFGTEDEDARVEHPGNQEVIVLFVIGGISYKEVGQVQAVLQEYTQISGNKIILMSNNIIGNEELLQLIFS